jgi:hypothetical protein
MGKTLSNLSADIVALWRFGSASELRISANLATRGREAVSQSHVKEEESVI